MSPCLYECRIRFLAGLLTDDISYRLVPIPFDCIALESQHHIFDGHLILGQRSCLIGADHIDASERLYGS